MTVLELRGLVHRYRHVPAVGGVDLAVESGEIVALLGRSGCGKTTVLRAIAGLIVPTGGQVRLGDRAMAEGGREIVPTERRGVGLVFQDYALFPSMSVGHNVGFGLHGREPERVDSLLERLGLAELRARRPAELSGGQQQRVGLARALAPRPSVLLLDEPFANLDGPLRMELGALLRESVRAEGAAAVLVSHDRADALALADRLVLMAPGPRGGTVVRQGHPVEVYRDPRTDEAATLTGEAWFLAAQPIEHGAQTAIGAVPTVRGAPSARLCVRPEHTRFVPGPGEARVRHAAFQGAHTRLLVEHPALDVPAMASFDGTMQVGERGAIHIAEASWIA